MTNEMRMTAMVSPVFTVETMAAFSGISQKGDRPWLRPD